MVEVRGRGCGRSEAAVERGRNAGRGFAVGSVVGRNEVSIVEGGRAPEGRRIGLGAKTDGGGRRKSGSARAYL